jgi:hypothetical protein
MFCLGNHGCFVRVPNDNLSALVHPEYLDIERLRDHQFKMKDKLYAVYFFDMSIQERYEEGKFKIVCNF